MKTIVTHLNPDLDAVCSVWLLRRSDKDFGDASVVFVPAGETLNDQPADSNPNIVHVDTGGGLFDHHHLEEKICASQLVFDYLKKKLKKLPSEEALERLIKIVCETDHFGECLWPESANDRHEFDAAHILNGLKIAGKLDDSGLIEFGGKVLEGIYQSLKLKVEAEEELEKGIEFESPWGTVIAVETSNNEVLKLGQKQGYTLAVQKDPRKGWVRIKARPDSNVDLTSVKETLQKMDPQATWFLHINKRMLLNGSTRNPKMKPSRLGLEEVVEVLKKKRKA